MIASTPYKAPVLPFGLPFEGKLDAKNRWVILANLLPWDRLAAVYNSQLCTDNGRPAVSGRIAVGALLVKHMLHLSDEETILQIQENVYLQYFVGLEVFQTAPLFDPSLFVFIRKRLGAEGAKALESAIVAAMRADRTASVTAEKQADKPNDDTQNCDNEKPKEAKPEEAKLDELKPEEAQSAEAKPNVPKRDASLAHRGHLKIDTTVAPQKIKYPTDLDLLNTARKKTEKYIDLLCHQLNIPRATYRTYRRIARKEYLKIAKMKRKGKQALRAGIRKQLAYVKRNLQYIKELIALVRHEDKEAPLKGWTAKNLAEYETIQTLYTQQQNMYDAKGKRCDNRIVSISQPYVRPIVRGKAHVNTEFGAKIAIATMDGISTVDKISWESYHESYDLQIHIDRYVALYNCYPEKINCDKIYHTTANHELAKIYGIRLVGTKLGRPKKIDQTPEAKRAAQAERNQRNVVEGKIGQAKNAYGLDQIVAKTQDTSVVWITCCLIATNLVRWLKDVSLYLFSKTNFFPFLDHIYHFIYFNFYILFSNSSFLRKL